MPDGAAALWNQAIETLSTSSTLLVGGRVDGGSAELQALLHGEDYNVVHARDEEELFAASRSREIHLLILDSTDPDSFEVCRRFKEARSANLTPVLMLLENEDIEGQINALDCGADELIAKPFHPDLLRTRIRAILRHKNAMDQLEQSETVLFALAHTIESKDMSMSGHCERIATFSVALGMSIGLPRPHLLTLYRGGYLHDIGKVAVPDSILFKPGPLTAGEWHVMKSHTTKGEEICRSLRSLGAVRPIIRSHHERWDGSGYPDGLSGPGIPLLARILQLADVYDALTSARVYKPALTPEEALAVMQEETDRGWRDPKLMAVFRELHQSAVLHGAASQAVARQGVDSVRESLNRLSRQLNGAMRGISPDGSERLLKVRQQVSPILDSDGNPHQPIPDTRLT
jgi:putative two-component system response regulator